VCQTRAACKSNNFLLRGLTGLRSYLAPPRQALAGARKKLFAPGGRTQFFSHPRDPSGLRNKFFALQAASTGLAHSLLTLR